MVPAPGHVERLIVFEGVGDPCRHGDVRHPDTLLDLGDVRVTLGVSIGAAIAPADADHPQILLRLADEAESIPLFAVHEVGRADEL